MTAIHNDLLGLPPRPTKGRDDTDYSRNKTASYIPKVFLNLADVSKPVERMIVYQEMTPELWTKIRSDLKNHFEVRLQLILQQMFLLYKTGHRVAIGRTEAVTGTGNKRFQMVAAHPCTLPSLILDGNNLVFGKGSYYFDSGNMTHFLPTVANDVDENLDLCTQKVGMAQNFRDRCITLLNLVAREETTTTPLVGFKVVLDWAEILLNRLEEVADEDQLEVLEVYLNVVRFYQRELSDEMICQLCFKTATKVDDAFYFAVRDEMHYLLKAEIKVRDHFKRKVLPILGPITTPDDWNEWLIWMANRKRITTIDYLEKPGGDGRIKLTKKERQYVELCVSNPVIRTRSRNYLSSEEQHVLQNDLLEIRKLKTSLTAAQLDLSPQVHAIYTASLIVIKNQTEKEPRAMALVMSGLLYQMNFKPNEKVHVLFRINEQWARDWQRYHSDQADRALNKLSATKYKELYLP